MASLGHYICTAKIVPNLGAYVLAADAQVPKNWIPSVLKMKETYAGKDLFRDRPKPRESIITHDVDLLCFDIQGRATLEEVENAR